MEYTHLEIKQQFEFNGVSIIFDHSNWMEQHARKPYSSVSVYSKDVKKDDTKVTGAAADFIVKEFKKTDLYKNNILNINDFKVK